MSGADSGAVFDLWVVTILAGLAVLWFVGRLLIWWASR